MPVFAPCAANALPAIAPGLAIDRAVAGRPTACHGDICHHSPGAIPWRTIYQMAASKRHLSRCPGTIFAALGARPPGRGDVLVALSISEPGTHSETPHHGPVARHACSSETVASARRAVATEIRLGEGDAPPDWIELFPPGPDLAGLDGRKWTLGDLSGIAERSMAAGLKLPVDWEHSQFHRAPKGEEAPASGWIDKIEVRGGRLAARVDWTERGAKSVSSKEYRYFSPDFNSNAAGEIVSVNGGGLVGHPNFVLGELAARQQQEGAMNDLLKRLIAALGLDADTTADRAVAAVEALKGDLARAVAAQGSPSLDKWVPRADHEAMTQRAVAAESKLAERSQSDIDAVIDQAVADGKITPATKDYHRANCAREGGLEEFKRYIAAVPAIASTQQPPGNPPEPGTAGDEAYARAIAKQMNLPEDYLEKRKQAQGGS